MSSSQLTPSSFPFLALPPELQALVASLSDASSRMSLYLTCPALYFTPNRQLLPSRPRMSWRFFAKVSSLPRSSSSGTASCSGPFRSGDV